MKPLLAVAIATVIGLAAHAGSAATYNFSWSSAGSTPDIAGNSATVTGTFDIDRMPGESFVAADVININMLFTGSGPNGGSFNISRSNFNSGSIAADGRSVLFTDKGFDAFGAGGTFICNAGDCFNGIVSTNSGSGPVNYDFGSQASVRASFVTSLDTGVAPIPLPAGLPLILTSLAGLALIGRRRRS